MIPVTKPFLPPLAEYQKLVSLIFERGWITNHGPMVNELEMKLKEYFHIPHVLFLSNGTIALQLAIRALELKGEVITTPFSYVATTHTILWENCTPVFADIEKGYLCIDPDEITKKITPRTQAILATHVYGNACRVHDIADIAKRHGIHVIYDSAHAFGSYYQSKSLYSFGDISTASFHATKIFQTGEGGAVFTHSAELLRKMALLRNFGHTSPVTFEGIGLNGKNSELHAAMGLSILPYIAEIIKRRKDQWHYYRDKLHHSPALQLLQVRDEAGFNCAYFPVILENPASVIKTVDLLQSHNIFPRRYFYPSLNELQNEESRTECPISSDISARIICLPLYHALTKEEQDLVIRVVLRSLHN